VFGGLPRIAIDQERPLPGPTELTAIMTVLN
jgi:hypothetical protein